MSRAVDLAKKIDHLNNMASNDRVSYAQKAMRLSKEPIQFSRKTTTRRDWLKKLDTSVEIIVNTNCNGFLSNMVDKIFRPFFSLPQNQQDREQDWV